MCVSSLRLSVTHTHTHSLSLSLTCSCAGEAEFIDRWYVAKNVDVEEVQKQRKKNAAAPSHAQ